MGCEPGTHISVMGCEPGTHISDCFGHCFRDAHPLTRVKCRVQNKSKPSLFCFLHLSARMKENKSEQICNLIFMRRS